MATAIHRTRLLRSGQPLHAVIEDIARAWGVRARILPICDQPVATVIHGPEGPIAFQDYMVKLRTEVDVRRVEFVGAEGASAAPGVVEAIREADVVVIAPSNPIVSIGPILAVRGIREALRETRAARMAISPIIAGQVVKGPAAKMLASLGYEVSALGVARMYAGDGLIDIMVIDEQDRELAARIESELGLRCLVTDTIMASEAKKEALARATLEAAASLRP